MVTVGCEPSTAIHGGKMNIDLAYHNACRKDSRIYSAQSAKVEFQSQMVNMNWSEFLSFLIETLHPPLSLLESKCSTYHRADS